MKWAEEEVWDMGLGHGWGDWAGAERRHVALLFSLLKGSALHAMHDAACSRRASAALLSGSLGVVTGSGWAGAGAVWGYG